MKLTKFLSILTLSLVATGASAAEGTTKSAAPKKDAPAAAAKAPAAGKTIEIGSGDPKNKKDTEASMFNVTEISAKAGQEITIKFTNRSKSAGMMHNLVITKPGKAKDVATASMSAGQDKGWVADSSEVLFKTKLLDAGQSETIKVLIAEAGDYPFICTFPGHFPMMQGVLKVTK